MQVILAHQGNKPAALIRPLGKDLRHTLYARLASSGAVRAGQGRILGLFPAHRWPTQDSRHKTQLRQQLIQALVQQHAPAKEPPRSSPCCTPCGANTRSSTPRITA